MSKKRRPVPRRPRFAREVTTFAHDYPSGAQVRSHRHRRDQLIYASSGVMTVRTARGAYVVPPQRALWVPCGTAHAIAISGRVAMRTLYLRPGLASKIPRSCCVVHVSPLLRELILHAVTLGFLDGGTPAHARVIGLILDLIETRPMAALELPVPADPRARRVADRILARPDDTLARSVAGAGASRRTLERAFVAETSMSLGRWRQQARLLSSLERLAAGDPVTAVALDVGYGSSSAFVAAFRGAFGVTPGRYYAVPPGTSERS
jgi:AraC-like DNA-binding protein